MNRYLLLLGCSLVVAGATAVVAADNQLDAVKELYLKEFQNIDVNHDGAISQQEYLTYQFNSLRANLARTDGFDNVDASIEPKADVAVTEPVAQSDALGVPAALQDMANFEFDDNGLDIAEAPIKLTKEDVMPESAAAEEQDQLDLSISEDESLQRLIDGPSSSESAPSAPLISDDQMTLMLDTIKKTLPKKIDEITTWVDITFDDGVINYVYQAELDMTSYSDDELKVLKQNIQNEACAKAYTDMCPRVKPMFIDKGIDMRIIYLDKHNENISSCEFNKTTCAE